MRRRSGWSGRAWWLVVGIVGLLASPARAQEFPSFGGRFAVGGVFDARNQTAGPSVEYWLTDSVGLGGSVHLVGDFDVWDGTVEFLAPIDFELFTVPTRPYVGGGYRKVKEDARFGGSLVKLDGDGFIAFGGLRQAVRAGHGLLSWGLEVEYSAFDVKAKYAGFDVGVASYDDLTLGVRVYYHF